MIDFSCTMVWILIYSFYAYFIVLVCLWYAEFGDSLLLFIYQAFYSFSFFDFKSLFFKHWIKFKKNNFINYHKCAKVSDWVVLIITVVVIIHYSVWQASGLQNNWQFPECYQCMKQFSLLLLNDWTNGREQMEMCFKSTVVVTIHMVDAYLFGYVDCLTEAVHIFFDMKCCFDFILSSNCNYKVRRNLNITSFSLFPT